jgi:hypothetical protein
VSDFGVTVDGKAKYFRDPECRAEAQPSAMGGQVADGARNLVVSRSVFNSAAQFHVLAGMLSVIFHATDDLINDQDIRSGLIARSTQECVLFYPGINRVRRDARQIYIVPALAAGRCYDRRGGLRCGVSLDHWPNLSHNVPRGP